MGADMPAEGDLREGKASTHSMTAPPPAAPRDTRTSYCMEMIPSGVTGPISSMLPFLCPNMSMTEPEYSSGSSTSTNSNGSQRLPSISCSKTWGGRARGEERGVSLLL